MQENQTLNEEFSYDVVDYPSYILPQTHPGCFAVIAKLYGMNPAPPEKCRVLELGCGDGLNLNWLASNLPESEFVGVDLAKTAIGNANKSAADLELQNISFFRQDVLEINEKTFGKFDYITAYGLFSWVPEVVRQKILSLYNELLNPNGVGLISYNVYPGSYRRQIARDLLHFHSQKFEKPLEKVAQGVGFVDFLTNNTGHLPVYQEILKHELNSLADRPFENIYHDELAEFSQPFYFTEFIAEAEKHGLKFLSESEYLFPYTKSMSEEVLEFFENSSRDTIEFEQYSDFFYCRRFRQTLLCKKDVITESRVTPPQIKDLYILSLLKPTSQNLDLNPNAFVQFLDAKGNKLDIGHNLTKVALALLVRAGSHPVKFDNLIEKANEVLQTQGVVIEDLEKEAEITASIFLQLFSPNELKFYDTEAKFLDYVSENPIVNKFARWQAKNHSNLVLNFYGVGLTVQDNFVRTLLTLLDGTRTREELIAELTEFVRSDAERDNKDEFIAKLPETLDQNLFVLSKMGFLVG